MNGRLTFFNTSNGCSEPKTTTTKQKKIVNNVEKLYKKFAKNILYINIYKKHFSNFCDS